MGERENQISTALAARATVRRVNESLQFLARESSFLAAYEDLEAFAFSAFELDVKRANAVEYHVSRLRAEVVRVLWPQQMFLSVNTIEQILFLSIKANPSNPLQEFARIVFVNGLHHPGFVLYPLHSFGFLGGGLFSLMRKARNPTIDLSSQGISLTAQTNSLERSEAFLERTRNRLGIGHAIPSDLLEHFYKSRDLRWYTNNPLLAVRISSYTSGYHENQRILEMKLRVSATLIAMMSVLGKRVDQQGAQTFSTRRANNWQTLDIRHYLLFQARPRRKELTIDCTPMHLNQVEMAELSDLGTDIDPSAWGAGKKVQLQWLQEALGALERGYLKHCLIGSNDQIRRRLFRKLMTSINYFRRSLRATTYEPENVVALAISFETLLTDQFVRGGTAVLLNRVSTCLKGVRGSVAMKKAVSELFECRGAIVHAGASDAPPSLWLSRRAYVYAFREVVRRLEAATALSADPVSGMFP